MSTSDLYNKIKIKKNRIYIFFRYRTSEISFVLKSIATLIASLKKVSTDKGNFKKSLNKLDIKVLNLLYSQ